MGKYPCLCLERNKEGWEDCLFRKTRENAGRLCLLLLRYSLWAPEFVTAATQDANAEWGHRIRGGRACLTLDLLQLLQRAEGLADTSRSLSVLHSRQVIHASVSRARRSLVSCFTPQSTSFAWLLECRRASPVAQMVKNLPAIQET